MVDQHALAEAHAHERRRLLAAFVCGRPSDRPEEVTLEPSRPTRSLVAGAALAALLVAAFTVPRLLAPAPPVDLTRLDALLVDEHGRTYVVQESTGARRAAGATEVSELANATSAMLLLGPDARAEPTTSGELGRLPRGPRLGIEQAPGAPPAPDELDQDGWTACTADGAGTSLVLGGHDALAGLGPQAFVATVGERVLVAARGHAYEVPPGPGRAPVLAAVAGRSVDDLPEVPRAWVRLLPRGGRLELSAFGLDDADLGAAPRPRPGLPVGARVGDLLRPVSDDPTDPPAYLLRGDDVLDLTAFALAVYRALTGSVVADPPRELDVTGPPGGAQRFVRDDPALAWPNAPLEAAATSEVCAVLDAASPSGEQVRLALPTPGREIPADAASVRVAVEPGRGALVQTHGATSDDGTEAGVALVDDRGHLFALDGEARERLGYADVAPAPVPDSWLSLLVPDVALDREAASCPVGWSEPPGEC